MCRGRGIKPGCSRMLLREIAANIRFQECDKFTYGKVRESCSVYNRENISLSVKIRERKTFEEIELNCSGVNRGLDVGLSS